MGLTFATVIAFCRFIGFNEPALDLTVFPAIIVLELALLRPWCHRFCPIGALMSLFAPLARRLLPQVDAQACLRSSGEARGLRKGVWRMAVKAQRESPRLRRPSRKLAALQVFAGGASYGVMATTYKLAYAAGLTWQQVVATMCWFGFAAFTVALGVWLLVKRVWSPLSLKQAVKLAAVGSFTGLTSILNCCSMSLLPVSMALTLLFQFTWVGIVIQIVLTRRAPSLPEVGAAAIILIGTYFASGLSASQSAESYDLLGMACGCLAAISCALFVTLSGRVEVERPTCQRGFFMCLGAALVSLAVCPDYLLNHLSLPAVQQFGPILGGFGVFLPVLLFGFGTPHLPAGLNTILAAAELPVGLLVAMIVLAEPMSIAQWAGVAAIMAGISASQIRSHESSSKRERA